jgi:hypothetical protein
MSVYSNTQSGSAMPVYDGGLTPVNITTAATTLIKTGRGTIGRVIVNTAGAGSSIAIYDGLTAAGTLIATVSSAAQTSLTFGAAVSTGLCVVTSGGTPANITILYA